jgi:thioredoxin-related protein
MTDLNLHGNQWHDTNSKLAKALNVRGIPFFIIYDKEGKLYMYDAPRPSHPQLKNYLEGLK